MKISNPVNASVRRALSSALAAVLLIIALSGVACAQLKVVTTLPDLAELAEIIGGNDVEARSLTRAGDDLHLVQMRPSQLIAVRRADLFCQLGMSAEHAWVPALLWAARNDGIKPGSPGFVDCSRGLRPLRVPDSPGRGNGPDLHPFGNPHYNLDPEGMRLAARHVRDGLVRLRPERKEAYHAACAAWERELDKKLLEWKAELAPLKGASFIEAHDAWIYFAARFGLEIAARLEPKPGLSPTPNHLRTIQATAQAKKVGLIVGRPRDERVTKKFAADVSAHAAVLTLSGPGRAGGGWLRWMDGVVSTFAEHLRKP